MLTDVVIEDYQALHRARLRLGKFTVVTGPTGSGKSAVVRALKLAVFNARGTGYVRTGAKSAKVILQDDLGLLVGITRGGRGQDAYLLDVLGEKKTFTKLAGGVPEEVAALLQLGDINFAGQFDRPFLLAETGSVVARTLGELTNVTLVFDAAREANRRKLDIARELRVWEKNLESLTEQARAFRTLKERRAAAVEATERHGICRHLALEIGQLTRLAQAVTDAEKQLAYTEDYLEATAPPPTQDLDLRLADLQRLRALRYQHDESERAERQWEGAADAAARDEKQAHLDLHRALLEAGTCPTCGREMDPDD